MKEGVVENPLEELAKLQELKDKGTITDAEFELMKQDILSWMVADESSGTTQLSPPPSPQVPPVAASSSKKGLVIAVVVLLVGAGIGAWFIFGKSDSKPKTINVTYIVEVVTTDYCYDFSDTEYSDIPYAEAEIFDGGGYLLGSGTLDGGVDLDESCVFTAEFTIDESADGKYRALAGDSGRGFVNYTDNDVMDGALTVDIIIEE
jgi:hypothetical protein